jgi:hypothetical protein
MAGGKISRVTVATSNILLKIRPVENLHTGAYGKILFQLKPKATGITIGGEGNR